VSEEKPQPTLADVLDAQRKTYAKLLDIERLVTSLTNPQGSLAPRKSKTDPQHALLRTKMMRVWSTAKGSNYVFDGKDARAIAGLLKKSLPIDEVLARWERAVAAGCGSMRAFEANISNYAATTANARPVVTGDAYEGKAP